MKLLKGKIKTEICEKENRGQNVERKIPESTFEYGT